MCLTLLNYLEGFPPLLWLDNMLHGAEGENSGNLAKKRISKAFFKGTLQSLATQRELLASTLMPQLMPLPVKLKRNNAMAETIQIQVLVQHVQEFCRLHSHLFSQFMYFYCEYQKNFSREKGSFPTYQTSFFFMNTDCYKKLNN